MPRLYAQNRTSMWADEDFRALSADAQNLYNYLLAHPSTTYAGVADWFPKRLAHVNTTWTAADVDTIGRELAAGHFVVIDEDWDEVCIRSFLRWEQVLKVPNLARATAHAFEKVESPHLQRVIIHELLRLKAEHEDWTVWDLNEYVDILTRRPPLDGRLIDGPINTSGMPTPNPSNNPPRNPSPKGSRKGSPNPSSKGSEVTSNQYPLPLTPEPGPFTSVTIDANVDGESDEFAARAHLKALDLDYAEVRRLIDRNCHRQPTAALIEAIAVAAMKRSTETPKKPMAWVATTLKNDWAEWQQMIDGAVAS